MKRLLAVCGLLVFAHQSDAVEIGKNTRWSLQYKTALAATTAFSPDSKKLITANTDGKIQVWDAQSGRLLATSILGARGMDNSIYFSPDGKHIVAKNKVLSAANLRLEHTLGHYASISSFSPDSQLIAAAISFKDNKRPMELNIYDAKDGRKLSTLTKGKAEDYYPSSLRFTNDGRFLIVGIQNRRSGIEVWNLKTGKMAKTLKTPFHITALELSPDEKTIAIGTTAEGSKKRESTYSIRLYDFPALQPMHQFPALKGHITSLAFHSGGKLLASTQYSSRPSIQIWDVEQKRAHLALQAMTRNANHVRFSPNGRLMAVTLFTYGDLGNPDTLGVFDVGTKAQLSELGALNDLTTFHTGQHVKAKIDGRWYTGRINKLSKSNYLLKMDNRQPKFWMWVKPGDLRAN